MEQSGRNNPCPHCERTKDGDCRWNDKVILCHSGSSLKPGSVVTLNGKDWYLSRHNGGYDGSAAVFKRHKPKTAEPVIFRRQRQAVQAIEDLGTAETELQKFQGLASQALAIPPFEQMLDADIRQARDICDQAFALGKVLIKRIARAKRHDPAMAIDLERVLGVHRDLRYQLADLERYCANPGLYWQQMIIQGPQAVPAVATEEEQGSTWAFWHNIDANYRPRDAGVAELYDAYKQERREQGK